jgi:orotidine-5'-phosphate decarboxylase
LVVGATAPAELGEIRNVAPGLAFLVPGVGAQGGEIGPALDRGRAVSSPAGGRPGGGLLVNVSRGIAASASGSGDPAALLAATAADWAARLPVLP